MKRYFYSTIKLLRMPPKSSKSSKKEKESSASQKLSNTDSISELKSGDIQIKIFAKPGSKESSLVSNTDHLEVKIGAPAVDGEANEELIKFLSKVFNCRKSDVNLERGGKNRSKVLTISKETGLSIHRIREIINSNLNE